MAKNSFDTHLDNLKEEIQRLSSIIDKYNGFVTQLKTNCKCIHNIDVFECLDQFINNCNTNGPNGQSVECQASPEDKCFVSHVLEVPTRVFRSAPVVIATIDEEVNNRFNTLRVTDGGVDEDWDPFNTITEILDQMPKRPLNEIIREFLALDICSVLTMDTMAQLIHERAVTQPYFSSHYSLICKSLSSLQVFDYKTRKTVGFRYLLITKCMTEFKTSVFNELNARQQSLANNEDSAQFDVLFDGLAQDMKGALDRCLANFRFISDLFKVNVFRIEDIIKCVECLMKESTEESIQCLIVLLKNCGQKIRNDVKSESNVNYLNNCFQCLQRIANGKEWGVSVSTGTQAMLRDVINQLRNFNSISDKIIDKSFEFITQYKN